MKQSVELNLDLPPESVIFGCSEAMKKVQRDLSMIASADVPVLIQGPAAPARDHCEVDPPRLSLGEGPLSKSKLPGNS